MDSSIFFVRGFAKSGTNWMCNLMNLHPEINCEGEFQLQPLFEGFHQSRGAGFKRIEDEGYRDQFQACFHKMVSELITSVCGQAPVCGDRTPSPLRATFLPGVPTLYITRDGRDIAVSWFFHTMNYNIDQRSEMIAKREQHQADSDYFENNKRELLTCESLLREVARNWNDTIVDDFAMMARGERGEIDFPCYHVRYEQLQQQPEELRAEMYEFLGVDPANAQPLSFREVPGFGKTLNTGPTRFYRKGVAGAWAEYFTDEQLDWFNDEAGEALQLLGLDTATVGSDAA